MEICLPLPVLHLVHLTQAPRTKQNQALPAAVSASQITPSPTQSQPAATAKIRESNFAQRIDRNPRDYLMSVPPVAVFDPLMSTMNGGTWWNDVFFGLEPLEMLHVYIQMPLNQLVCLQVHINQLQYLRDLLSTKSRMTKNRQHVILYINTVQYSK